MNTASQVEQLHPVADKAQSHVSVGDRSQVLLIRTWSALKWIAQRAKAQQARKNLRVCESVSGSVSASASTKATPAGTATPAPNEIRITMPGAAGSTSSTWTIVALLTFLTLIPSLLLCMTPFARLLIVFHFLRQALGLQSTPSNQTLIGLALVLTFFLMQPVGASIYSQAVQPLQEGQISAMDAVQRGAGPIHQFMVHYVREKDVALFVDLAKEQRPHDPNDLSMRVLAPAYILSELKAGFQIGAILFLPFMVIDMVVASITTSVGMLQLPPVVISTPLKLLLFVMVDGWGLLISSLMRSFS